MTANVLDISWLATLPIKDSHINNQLPTFASVGHNRNWNKTHLTILLFSCTSKSRIPLLVCQSVKIVSTGIGIGNGIGIGIGFTHLRCISGGNPWSTSCLSLSFSSFDILARMFFTAVGRSENQPGVYVLTDERPIIDAISARTSSFWVHHRISVSLDCAFCLTGALALVRHTLRSQLRSS